MRHAPRWAKKDPVGEPAPNSEIPVKIIGIQERHRTIRWAFTCVLLAVAFWCVKDAIIALYGKPATLWGAVIAAIGVATVIWAGPPLKWIGRLRAYMKNDHDRVIDLELKLDPQRESSGIEKDGTTPHDNL